MFFLFNSKATISFSVLNSTTVEVNDVGTFSTTKFELNVSDLLLFGPYVSTLKVWVHVKSGRAFITAITIDTILKISPRNVDPIMVASGKLFDVRKFHKFSSRIRLIIIVKISITYLEKL